MSATEEIKRVYFHRGQMKLLRIQANKEYIIAPRGWGKSDGIDAPRLERNVFAMPRSVGAVLSPTYGKLLRNTLPAVVTALSRHGYKHGIHYVIGCRADKKLNFAMPHTIPLDWDYVMHWFNGSIQNLLSFDRPMSANSMSLDYIMGFESKYLDYEKIKSEVLQANRGNEQLYGKCPWHHGHVFTTDMPTSKMGDWMFEKKELVDKELIHGIVDTQVEIQRLKANKIDPQRLRALENDLAFLRRNAVYYEECDPFDNYELLGSRFYAEQKRDLPPFIFDTSILNKRVRKVEGGFYSALNEKIHYYTSYNNTFLEKLNYDIRKAQEADCRKDGDMDWDKPLCIALDYNANINWLACGQGDDKIIRTLSSFFVKGTKRTGDLLEKFSEYYHVRNNRDIVYYYTHTALQGAYAISDETFADFIIAKLSRLGWNVYPVYMGHALNHSVKHRYINDALTGNNYQLPLINQDNNEELIISLERTKTKITDEGFKKDKSEEKKPETPTDLLEHRTDSTDAWDELVLGCIFHPVETILSGVAANNYG